MDSGAIVCNFPFCRLGLNFFFFFGLICGKPCPSLKPLGGAWHCVTDIWVARRQAVNSAELQRMENVMGLHSPINTDGQDRPPPQTFQQALCSTIVMHCLSGSRCSFLHLHRKTVRTIHPASEFVFHSESGSCGASLLVWCYFNTFQHSELWVREKYRTSVWTDQSCVSKTKETKHFSEKMHFSPKCLYSVSADSTEKYITFTVDQSISIRVKENSVKRESHYPSQQPILDVATVNKLTVK